MIKCLLFAFLVIGFNAKAQTDSTQALVAAIPDSLLKAPTETAPKIACTDTVRLGNFFVSVGVGSRVNFNEVFYSSGRGFLATWGYNYGLLVGYKTLNDRFSFETGYLVRELNNVSRFPFFNRQSDMVISSPMKQIPLYVKMRVLNKAAGRFEFRTITGLNFTSINEMDYVLSGSFDEVSRNGNRLTMKSKQPFYSDEFFVVDRDPTTSTKGTNLHITAEIGLESAFKLSKNLEAGASVTYQYAKNSYERLDVNFMGNDRLSKSQYPQTYIADDPALNIALYLKYNLDKMTILKCKKAE